MVIDERRDHSFRLPRPRFVGRAGDVQRVQRLSHEANETPQWAADPVKKWYGERPEARAPVGPAIKAGRAGTPEGEKLLLDIIAREFDPICGAGDSDRTVGRLSVECECDGAARGAARQRFASSFDGGAIVARQ